MRRIDAALVARFKVDLETLVDTSQIRLGVAVSGGSDSLALLLLAHAALPGQVIAATVDHQLRPAAAGEAACVAAICAERGIAHTILTPEKPISGSVQASARAARYALLAEWSAASDCSWVATAHHIEDQSETLLMRLNRGSGVAGLAGVRRMNGIIIRPVLGWHRAELASVVAQAGVRAIDDPSNDDARFDRVRMRQALATADWLKAEQIAHSAQLLAEANTALDWATDALVKERLKFGYQRVTLDPALLPRELRRRLTLKALSHIDPAIAPRGDALIALIEALVRGEARTLGSVLVRGGPLWRFQLAPPRLETN